MRVSNIGEGMIYYSALIVERTRGFTDREWVFAEIDRWLAAGATV